MSFARSLTSFCIDISPSMGARRQIEEDVIDQDAAYNNGSGSRESDREAAPDGTRTRTRTTTDLEWAMEFVGRKVQNVILSGLKTAKVHLLLYGSPRTNNTLLKYNDDVTEGYDGIDEIVLPEQPTMATLELVRCLRACDASEEPFPADATNALIAALATLDTKDVGGVTNTWNRTIYLITDGKSKMETDDSEIIASKFRETNVALKVVGIDFDDEEIGFKEEGKDRIKAENEAFWHSFVEDLPGSGVASAARAIAQAALPAVQLQNSAPYATTLTFGDPSMRAEDPAVLDIAVKMYKSTAATRPLNQKMLSKISQESAAARSQTARIEASSSQMKPSSTPNAAWPRKRPYPDSDAQEGEAGDWLTYGVEMQRKYFLKEDLEHVEGGINAAEPLPEGAEATFERAYKLGATLVAINDDLQRKQETRAGLEIIQFTNKALYRRSYHMSETWFVFASDGNDRAEVQLSSLIHAMWNLGKYAIVRFVRRAGTEPKLGILAPQIRDEAAGYRYECLFFVEAPFRQDLKRFNFPPLDRVINRDGQELYEHSTLPSKEMQHSMDDLVDSMDLMDGDDEDADEGGEPTPWFQCQNSFNPAIHNTKEAVSWRAFHPDDRTLPRPQAEVMKYLQAPEKITKRSEKIAQKCRELFDLQFVPTSALRRQAGRREAAQRAYEQEGQLDGAAPGELKELDLGGVMDEELAAAAEEAERTAAAGAKANTNGEESQVRPAHETAQSSTIRESDSRTIEPEAQNAVSLPSSSKVVFDAEDPVKDFDSKLGSPDFSVEEVVDGMCALIRRTIDSSFGSNNYAEARDMLQALRRSAIDFEEDLRYNVFLRQLKARLLAAESNARDRSDFWDGYVRGREELSLIRDDEALSNATGVDKKAAAEFINL